MKRTSISQIFNDSPIDQELLVKGWVRSVRQSKTFAFVVLNDGSSQDSLQIIVDHNIEGGDQVGQILMGSCVAIKGKIMASQGKGQSVEMHAQSLEIYGNVNESYPLQKKATSLEFLREQAHLRPRTNLFGAIFRLRHHLAQATHEFFTKEGFYYLNSPIITAVDAEGAGEMFQVTTMDLQNLPKDKKGEVIFEKDYYGKAASLCVTGQLEAECFAMGMGKVYTFGPTFRSENSNTPRHLSEFWMIEPEVAFADLEENADLATRYIKYLIQYALEKGEKEMAAIMQWRKWQKEPAGHMESLKHVMDSPFEKITYTQAIEILKESGKKFEFRPEWGAELQTEHERYLTDEHYKGPVIVTDYPMECKAFYMKQNDDGKTVRAMDVLVPGVGELIGGSQREDNLDKMVARMDQLGMQKEPLWWYMDLRKYGSCPHSGFGLGFERAVMYITGMKNIRDVIPFPRTPRNCDF